MATLTPISESEVLRSLQWVKTRPNPSKANISTATHGVVQENPSFFRNFYVAMGQKEKPCGHSFCSFCLLQIVFFGIPCFDPQPSTAPDFQWLIRDTTSSTSRSSAVGVKLRLALSTSSLASSTWKTLKHSWSPCEIQAFSLNSTILWLWLFLARSLKILYIPHFSILKLPVGPLPLSLSTTILGNFCPNRRLVGFFLLHRVENALDQLLILVSDLLSLQYVFSQKRPWLWSVGRPRPQKSS